MKVLINDKQKLLSAEAIEQTESRLAAAFSKFGFRISRIEVSVSDINGPRGGVDKECRLVAKTNKMGDVIATVTDESLTKSIRRAIARAERGVARRIQRHTVVDHDRYSDIGFVFYN
jgi:hypothetical protein